jgi:hypothetical protein
MPDETTKPVPRWLLASFLLYFVALLPALAWGLWSLIVASTFRLPVAIPAEIAALNLAPERLAEYVRANQQTKLVLSQGQLFLAALLMGGIGSYIHAVNSFVTYVGTRSFTSSWGPWYLLRPFMGVAMALVFYVVVRGGVLVLSGGVSQVDPYAMMTVAALAGMFSKQASDKLAEVFDTIFRSRADAERGDKLPGALKVTSVDPAKVAAGAQETTFTVRGEGFVQDSVVHAGGKPRATSFKSASELTFTLAAADLAAAGEIKVEVVNPAAGGGTSAPVTLTVEAAAPAPRGEGAAGADAVVPVPKVVGENANGSAEVIAEAPGTVAAGVATDGSEPDGTTPG